MLNYSINTQMKGKTSSMQSRKRDVTEIMSEINFTMSVTRQRFSNSRSLYRCMGYWQQNKKSSAVTQFHWKGEKVIDIMNTVKTVMFQDCRSILFVHLEHIFLGTQVKINPHLKPKELNRIL